MDGNENEILSLLVYTAAALDRPIMGRWYLNTIKANIRVPHGYTVELRPNAAKTVIHSHAEKHLTAKKNVVIT